MKCDELEEEYLWTNNVKTPSTRMVRAYNADDVDKAIAELKARIQLDDDEMAGFLQLEEECGGGDLRKYIAELKQKLEDVQRWRKCSEELPEDGSEVLASDGNGIWLCYKTTMCDGSPWFQPDGQPHIKGVTHWMPLPNAPKEADK